MVNSLPNDKILDWSKLKAFADDEINVINKLKFVSERIESILGKREMLVTSIFSFSENVCQKPPSSGSLKVGIVW